MKSLFYKYVDIIIDIVHEHAKWISYVGWSWTSLEAYAIKDQEYSNDS